jgi:hypothetical protein
MLTRCEELKEHKNPLPLMQFITEFDLYEIEIDWKVTINTLISSNDFNKIKSILTSKPELKELIMSLMSTNHLAKHAANLIDELKLNINDFPDILERIQKQTMRYHLRCYTNGEYGRDYKPLWKVEDIFEGFESMLIYLCEDLAFKKDEKLKKYAKAIALRNNVYEHLREETRKKLDAYELTDDDMKIDSIDDKFAPISEPLEEYFVLPEEVKVHFISTENEVEKISILNESESIGVDCEWRPALIKFHKTNIALMQISDKNNVFLVDMMSLANSKALDDVLLEIFSTKKYNWV